MPEPASSPRSRVLLELLVVLCLLRVYDLVRAAAATRSSAAISNGQAVLRLEALGHLDLERACNRWAVAHPLVAVPAVYVYEYAHVGLTFALLAWLWWRRPHLYGAARNALVLTNVVGLAVFFVLPVAPPRLLPHGGFVDAVAAAGLDPSHGGPVPADQYGAMPSLHLAWALWCALVLGWAVRTCLLRVMLLYPLVVAGVVVATANHYLLDVLAGVLLAAVSVRLARAWSSQTALVRPRAAAPADG